MQDNPSSSPATTPQTTAPQLRIISYPYLHTSPNLPTACSSCFRITRSSFRLPLCLGTPPSAMTSQRPFIGVATFLFSPRHPGRFLLGKRMGANGSGTYALPGGHLEHSESFESCAARELEEETGLIVDMGSLRFLTATNDVIPPSGQEWRDGEGARHYVTIFMVGRVCDEDEKAGREARVMEREKCKGWEWLSWTELVAMAETERQVEQEGRVGKAESNAEREGRGEVKRLFQPMRDLLEQRPGVVPRLA